MLIKNTLGYSVSISGVITNSKGQQVKQSVIKRNGKAYAVVSLLTGDEFNYISKPFYVHRLVAEYWLKQPSSNTDIVRHKDGNTLNNKAFNLEWITRGQISRPNGRQGVAHSYTTKQKISAGLKGSKHPKYKGYYICNYKKFESATQAAKALRITAKTVINRCKRELYEGWKFIPNV